MSKLRPQLTSGSTKPCMTNGTAYFMIYNAVKAQDGLVHGQLHAHGEHCAIGSYFEQHDNTSLPETLIDEVAAVNDSFPGKSNAYRRREVLRWLRWKLAQIGMPGFIAADAAKGKRR